MNNSPTILIFTDWYHPGYRAGGPVQSVYNLSCLLSKYFVVKVVTRITDLNSTEPYAGIVPNVWTEIEPNHFVQYLDAEKQKISHIKEIVKENKDNYILINGLYSFKFSMLPLFFSSVFGARKIFVAVRGMLHRSALTVKPFKKQVFLSLAKGYGLYKNCTLLSSSEKETSQILRVLGKVRVVTAPNLPILPKSKFEENKGFKKDGAIRLLFLGRIAPEKNPLTLLEALALIKQPCYITFCGTGIDVEYYSLFTSKLNHLPQNIQHTYIPEMPHDQIGILLEETDVMVLPSLGENFGHAIFESFVHSVPVIIGNNTPWTGIEAKMAGIEIPPTDAVQLRDGIEKFMAMDEKEYDKWRQGAYELSLTYFRENNFEEIYLRLFS